MTLRGDLMTSFRLPRVEGTHAKPERDRFYENLLHPLASPEKVKAAAQRLYAILEDSAQPVATKRHAAYYMAQVHEYRGELNQMTELLGFSRVRPGRDLDDYDFLSHAGWGHVFLEGQREAIARGIPPIYINSIPHSGSSFLVALITSSLNIERCRTSKGMYFCSRVIPSWLWTFAQGGATTHEHFIANPANIGVLEASSIERMVIHVRHPMAVLISAYRIFCELSPSDDELCYYLRRLNVSVEPADLRHESKGMAVFARMFMPYIADFFRSWMLYATCQATQIKINFSKYEDLFADPVRHGRKIISGHFGVRTEDLEAVVATLLTQAERGAHNFQGRDSNRKMAAIDSATRAVFADAFPPDLLQFYGYESP